MDSVTELDSVLGSGRSAATLGLLIGALSCGLWLATLIVVSLVNGLSTGARIGWELLIPLGATIALSTPLVVLATLRAGRAGLFALSAGSSLGGMLGVWAFLSLAGFAEMGALIVLIAVGTLGVGAALWVAVGVARRSAGGLILSALCALALATFIPAWHAIATGGAGESGYVGQAILATPLGLGAGLGAWASLTVGRLRTLAPASPASRTRQ